jgi:hypothetical protein
VLRLTAVAKVGGLDDVSAGLPRKTALREKEELRAAARVNLAVPALRRG